MNNSVTGNIVSTTPQLDLEPLAEIRVRQSSAFSRKFSVETSEPRSLDGLAKLSVAIPCYNEEKP